MSYLSCLTGLDSFVLQIKTKIVSSHTTDYKPVKQEAKQYSDTPPFSIPCNSISSTSLFDNDFRPIIGI